MSAPAPVSFSVAPLAFPVASTSQIQPTSGESAPAAEAAAPLPTRITRYRVTPEQVPVDFFADPDGSWEFASLVEMAGFNPEHPGASVGALTQPFDGFPEGSAVITEVGVGCRYVAIAQLPAGSLDSTSESKRVAGFGVSSQRPHRAA